MIVSFYTQATDVGLRMPYYMRAAQPNSNLKAAKQIMKGVSWIIIDEISLVGKFLMGFISERLKLIFNNDAPFGGLSVIALGDFAQVMYQKCLNIVHDYLLCQ